MIVVKTKRVLLYQITDVACVDVATAATTPPPRFSSPTQCVSHCIIGGLLSVGQAGVYTEDTQSGSP